MNGNTVPEGFMKNAQGHHVPVELIKPIDLARDQLVRDLVAKAHLVQDAMVGFKTLAMDDVAAFVQLSAEEYGVTLGGQKGNVTLMSFDGRLKIERANQEHFTFDERLEIAKQAVDSCLRRWSEGARPEIRAAVMHAFQVDKAGRVNRGRLLSLTQLEIEDPEWKQAMKAILDAQQVVGSKFYLRLFERIGSSEQWRPITLDLAAL